MPEFVDPTTPLPEAVTEAIAFLRTGKDHQYEIYKALFHTHDRTMYYVDLVVIGALQRSTALIDGFSLLVERRNALAAVPLLRLQLDSAMRLNACWLVEDPVEVAKALLTGKPLQHIKSSDGFQLTDAYLRKALAKNDPWIDPMYEKSSGFVHMSTSHLTAAITEVDHESRKFQMVLGPGRAWDEADMLGAVNAFITATNLIYQLCIKYGESRRLQKVSDTPAG